jgi:ribonuclease P protein component
VLPAAARLRGSADIALTVRRGARSGRGDLVAHTRPHAGPTRATVVVGRDVGGAVARNRLRRRVRHALRDGWDDLPRDVLLVVRAGPGAARLTPAALRAAAAGACTQAAGRVARAGADRGAR